jgi:hypothetical protein
LLEGQQKKDIITAISVEQTKPMVNNGQGLLRFQESAGGPELQQEVKTGGIHAVA